MNALQAEYINITITPNGETGGATVSFSVSPEEIAQRVLRGEPVSQPEAFAMVMALAIRDTDAVPERG